MKNIDINLVEHSGLHDYEIIEMNINYNNATVVLQLRSPSGELSQLTINNFVLFKINHEEEWGKGKYVVSSDLELNDISKTYDLEIQLNSGDIIFISYKIV